jgi:predicted sulfurtransferase
MHENRNLLENFKIGSMEGAIFKDVQEVKEQLEIMKEKMENLMKLKVTL